MSADKSASPPSKFASRTSKRTITITVLYFAAALTATGVGSESVELPLQSSSSECVVGFPLKDLADFLSRRHARTNLAKVLETSQWSVDAEMVDEPERVFLKGGEEVAVICPVSGG